MHLIKRVSVVSTGTVEIHPEHVARTRAPRLWWLMTSRRWTAPLPINVYVIEHQGGLVLFDTGQNRASVTDNGYFPRGLVGVIYSRLARFSIGSDETLTAQLAEIGYNIADVKVVVISHLHQDHIGGLAELTHADIIVGAAEIASAKARGPEARGYLTDHIFIGGLRWQPTEGELDLFGDGTLTIIPTPGHTPGSISLLATQDGMTPLLFVGDLTYDVSLLEQGHVPGIGDKASLEASTQLVKKLTKDHPGLTVLATHDPGAAQALKTARAHRVMR